MTYKNYAKVNFFTISTAFSRLSIATLRNARLLIAQEMVQQLHLRMHYEKNCWNDCWNRDQK